MKIELSLLEIRVIVEAVRFMLEAYGEDGALQYLGSRKKLKTLKEIGATLSQIDVHT